jgi:hypothetical protein
MIHTVANAIPLSRTTVLFFTSDQFEHIYQINIVLIPDYTPGISRVVMGLGKSDDSIWWL